MTNSAKPKFEPEPEELSDHDRLIKLERDVCWIGKSVTNHLKHHWAVTALALGAAFTTGGALLVALLKG